jgi:hypothetical protein
MFWRLLHRLRLRHKASVWPPVWPPMWPPASMPRYENILTFLIAVPRLCPDRCLRRHDTVAAGARGMSSATLTVHMCAETQCWVTRVAMREALIDEFSMRNSCFELNSARGYREASFC